MKFSIQKCPKCGKEANGTLETIQGIALLNFDGDSADYTGETKLEWNTQKTVKNRKGRITLVCEKGHDWKSEVTEP